MRIKKGTNTSTIAESLRQAINSGKLKPSERIIEREIAGWFDTSQIPVREALRMLEGEGFVVHRKFCGYTVRVVNPEEMMELHNLMRFLSAQLLIRAIPRYNEITLYRMRSIITELEMTNDVVREINLIIKFGEVMFCPAGMTCTQQLAQQILKRNIPLLLSLMQQYPDSSILAEPLNHFIGLCEKQKIDEAIRFISEQLDGITKVFVGFMSDDNKLVN